VQLWQRLAVAGLLFVALCGLFVHADVTAAEREPYPEPHELAADYDSYVGETILLFGDVTATDADGVDIEAESEGVTIDRRVDGTSAAVGPGGSVQVYGELRPNRTMAAGSVVVINDSGGAEWYKYVVSAVGAVGFLAAFLRRWRVDTETWTVEARDG